MTMHPKYTPYHVELNSEADNDNKGRIDILDNSGTPIAHVIDEETAAFIVRACNSHAALIEALDEILDYCNTSVERPRPLDLSKAKAALALAKKDNEK